MDILKDTILGSYDVVDSDTLQINKKIVSALVDFEKRIKELEVQKDKIRSAILEAMEKNDIDKFENDEILISYVKKSQRDTFESKRFKDDHPDFYEDYVKKTDVSASVKIKIKGSV